MRIHLHHVTHYRYDRTIMLGPQLVRLHPAPHCRARVESYALTVEPASHFINWQQDALANHLARLVFTQPTSEFRLTVDMTVDLVPGNPFDFFLDPTADQFPFAYSRRDARALAPYLDCECDGAALLQAYLLKLGRAPRPTLNFLVALNQQLQHDIRYQVRLEPGVQTPLQTLQHNRGSCRDSAWLLVQLLRLAGLAARFVSGYLLDVDPSVGATHPPLDTSQLHAWCEVYLPGAGWIGLDATSGLLTGMGHIPLACALQPGDAAPVEGATDVAQVQFSHRIELRVAAQ